MCVHITALPYVFMWEHTYCTQTQSTCCPKQHPQLSVSTSSVLWMALSPIPRLFGGGGVILFRWYIYKHLNETANSINVDLYTRWIILYNTLLNKSTSSNWYRTCIHFKGLIRTWKEQMWDKTDREHNRFRWTDRAANQSCACFAASQSEAWVGCNMGWGRGQQHCIIQPMNETGRDKETQ